MKKRTTAGTRELHIVTERPNTEPKPTPSVLKNWETEVWFSSGVGFGGTVLSLSFDRRERDGARDGEGERDIETERGRDGGRGREREGEGGREILTAEENCFLFRPREREGGGRERGRGEREGRRNQGERESVGGRDGQGGEREREKF